MTPRTLLVLPKTDREEVRVTINEYPGAARVDVRMWYWSNKAGECRPGRSGVSIPVDQLLAIINALTVALESLGG